MRKKCNDFDAVGAERMTDTELSKKLGSYQRMESIGILLGVILVITGCIMMFVYRNIIVICILVFSGVALFLLVAKPAQTNKKALMQQQLGGFFRTVEEKSGPNNDNWMTRTETLFRGIVVRCKDICDPTLDIAMNDTFQERKKDDITDPAAFRKHFAAHTADGREADDQVTPQLRDLVQKLEASSSSAKLCGLILRGGDLTLALNTRYVFAGVPEELDLRDIDGIRKWFIASLTGMGNLLDLITESPALTGTTE